MRLGWRSLETPFTQIKTSRTPGSTAGQQERSPLTNGSSLIEAAYFWLPRNLVKQKPAASGMSRFSRAADRRVRPARYRLTSEVETCVDPSCR